MTPEYNMKIFKQMFLPTHDGAVRFYKEKGLWTDADQTRQDYLVKLVRLYADGYEKCLATAKQKGIKIDPQNEEWNSLWEGYKKDNNFPKFAILSDAEIREAIQKLK